MKVSLKKEQRSGAECSEGQGAEAGELLGSKNEKARLRRWRASRRDRFNLAQLLPAAKSRGKNGSVLGGQGGRRGASAAGEGSKVGARAISSEVPATLAHFGSLERESMTQIRKTRSRSIRADTPPRVSWAAARGGGGSKVNAATRESPPWDRGADLAERRAASPCRSVYLFTLIWPARGHCLHRRPSSPILHSNFALPTASALPFSPSRRNLRSRHRAPPRLFTKLC